MDLSNLIAEHYVCSLYELAGKVVYVQFVTNKKYVDLRYLPDPLVYHLIRQPLEYINHSDDLDAAGDWKDSFSAIDLTVWIRLLKYEDYRPTLFRIYQELTNGGSASNNSIVSGYAKLCRSSKKSDQITQIINYGLILGSFLSEGSWYADSERILTLTKKLIEKLPANIYKAKILLECSHKLFHTLTMFFKFDKAARLFEELNALCQTFDILGVEKNYALLFTEFSRYCFHKNDYAESFHWVTRAMDYMNNTTPVSVQIQVLRQASRVCVVRHDFAKAKYLIHQALARAQQFYGPNHYKLGGLLIDFGFYLLNSDHVDQGVSVYREAFRLRIHTFGEGVNNLNVAIAEEDLAYALYVYEYSTGYFIDAMIHAQSAIDVMKVLLPPGNLMLCSANRVKALILEEQALDSYENPESLQMKMMLEEAERLHKDALKWTISTFGEENILTAKHYGNLGRLYQSMKKYKEAEEMHLKAIQLKEKILGSDDYEVGLSIGHLASLYNYQISEFKKAEELYLRSININLKLFSESYSGLEYDYRGLIYVYEHLADEELYLKYSNKLQKWHTLRRKCVCNTVSLDFYKVIDTQPIEDIVNTFKQTSVIAPASSTANACASHE